jgi:probable F420-dependent oxidoreductase
VSPAVAEIVHATRERLGAVGVWSGTLAGATVEDERAAVQRLEALGYGSVWGGERIGGRDTFARAGVILSATSTLVYGTGIANLWARHPATMQGAATTVAAAWPGRLVLGVGVSHSPIVVSSGQEYLKPWTRMVHYLDDMDAEAARFEPPVPFPRVLAALRPKMLELARDRADGAHPYFVPPEHTPIARRAIGPDRLLIPEQAVVLSTNPTEARRIARRHMTGYLRLPNYVNNLRHLGYGDEDFADGGSDRLVDAIVAWGDEEAIAARVTELRDSGADHVLLQPLVGNVAELVAQLETLAPAVVPG